ncbi:calcium-dependent phosphoinositide phospholipase C [Neolewinella xylanilytica]|uniref:Calcium-dependent phosphoinositide phospholipase C n=1 Tax=Neolewinella xylanilytica TaxID=1514080 RepID=A0A2S6I8B5_9BACT|nr:phosphatidylinositol-specific phospholipase C1-like protein [Neolewinella xylanilytica]PPK87733.1 calcium-dependent phosphoinositide phospholipase C [Neolewinella xylanilytica]
MQVVYIPAPAMIPYRHRAVLLLLAALSWLPTLLAQADGPARINELQVVATHNSYKRPMDGPVMQQLMALDSAQARSLDYAHPPLREQLDLGVRGLEIDVLHDPEGGRYRDPYGLRMQRENGLRPEPLDTTMLDRPGFKVLHVQDIDYRSSCGTLRACLEELRAWSDGNPGHLPVLVSINAKEGGIDRPGFTAALPFDDAAFTALDEEVRRVLSPDRLITPAMVRDTFATLRDAVLAGNWPTVDRARGRFFFVLDAGAGQTAIYTDGYPSLAGRLLFVTTDPSADEAAILFRNDPVGHEAEIRDLVRQGFLVRTRADAGTTEARNNDYSRLEAALASGAHYISTDYEQPDPRFGNDYRVRLPGEVLVRCNPLSKGPACPETLSPEK